jgi:hypothetical protein
MMALQGRCERFAHAHQPPFNPCAIMGGFDAAIGQLGNPLHLFIERLAMVSMAPSMRAMMATLPAALPLIWSNASSRKLSKVGTMAITRSVSPS